MTVFTAAFDAAKKLIPGRFVPMVVSKYRVTRLMVVVTACVLIIAAAPAHAVLLAHYTFDDDSISGSTLQNVANPGDNDGTISGAGVVTGIAGISGQAFQFNTLGSIALGTGSVRTQMEGTNTWSVSAWVRMNSVTPGDILYRRDTPGVTDAEGGLRVEALNTPEVFMQDGNGSSTSLTSPVAIDVGEWAHIVGIREDYPGNDWRLYVNGAEFSGAGTAFSIESSAGLPKIGVDLDGALDEIRVYDHALTQSEVLVLFADGAASQVSAPSALLLFGVGLSGLGFARRKRGA